MRSGSLIEREVRTNEMSIYSDCSQAISDLAELQEVFTEIDVVNHAAADGWNKAMFKEARKYANQIVSAKYRNGELARYGPVEYQGVQDYARRAGMIVYGGMARGPQFWTTPNGNFPRILRHEDAIQSSGRRKGTARHDEQPWSEQDLPADIKAPTVVPVKSGGKNGRTSVAAQREVERLTALLAAAQTRIGELEQELASAQSGSAPTVNVDLDAETQKALRNEIEGIVLELVEPYDTRLGRVEQVVERFRTLAQ